MNDFYILLQVSIGVLTQAEQGTLLALPYFEDRRSPLVLNRRDMTSYLTPSMNWHDNLQQSPNTKHVFWQISCHSYLVNMYLLFT